MKTLNTVGGGGGGGKDSKAHYEILIRQWNPKNNYWRSRSVWIGKN